MLTPCGLLWAAASFGVMHAANRYTDGLQRLETVLERDGLAGLLRGGAKCALKTSEQALRKDKKV